MKIAVLTSGGVDSSVALRLLKDQGHNVTAFYLKIWLEDELSFLGDCPWEEDLKYVREICRREKIPLKIIPLQKEYFDTVVAYTISEVKAGRTPNPDIMCNNHIKFGLFFDKIKNLPSSTSRAKFAKIATGHYAQIIKKSGHGLTRYFLKKSPDPIKDQTYFLANLKQSQLKKLIFPIGNLTKAEVRKLAEKYDLPNKNRKDSQGICFLGKLKYSDFIRHYLGEKKGDIIEYETGKVLGQHEGFFYYTIGQRRGIKLSGGPWFVVKKDIKKNLIYISRNYQEKKRDSLVVGKLNWFAGHPPFAGRAPFSSRTSSPKNLQVKLRHGEHIYNCKIKSLSQKFSHTRLGGKISVQLNKKDQGIAPGQFAVFYSKDICLGSGVILA